MTAIHSERPPLDAAAIGPRLGELAGALASAVLLLPVPWMALVIGTGLVWEQLWIRVRDTAPAARIGAALARAAQALARVSLRDPRNAPYLYTLVGVGLWTPALLVASFFLQQRLAAAPRFPWPAAVLAAFAYHVLMMGPYFRFFAYVSTLVHKEGHEPRGLFKPPFGALNHAFGWLLGPLYGHVPESYPLGHLRIHHKHDNGPEDVTSTLALDRSRPSQWFVYLRRFALYWSGISIVAWFARRGRRREARRMALAMACYFGAIGAAIAIAPFFGFFYLLLPHLCVVIYLAAINYAWHAFCDPDDPGNEWVSSVTILNGGYNVFEEDYHVVHHQRPQRHWSEAPADYAAHADDYRRNLASVFRDTHEFELFFWIVTGRHDLLASHFVDPTGALSQQEKLDLLVRRLKPVPQPT
jgi:hypothetical protein